MSEAGLRVVAVSDSKGGAYNPKGLDLDALHEHRQVRGMIGGFKGGEDVSNAELLELPVTVLVPAAVENQITGRDAQPGKARPINQGAHVPTSPPDDPDLHR